MLTGSRIVTRHHIELPYHPARDHAVMCNNNAILVAAWYPATALHIHSWSGQRLQTLTRQQLGIQEDDRIHAAAYNDRRQTLQLATGNRTSMRVDRLYSCSVSHSTSPYTHLSHTNTQTSHTTPVHSITHPSLMSLECTCTFDVAVVRQA